MSKSWSKVYIVRIIEAIPPSSTRKLRCPWIARIRTGIHLIGEAVDLDPEPSHRRVLHNHEHLFLSQVGKVSLEVPNEGFEVHWEVGPADLWRRTSVEEPALSDNRTLSGKSRWGAHCPHACPAMLPGSIQTRSWADVNFDVSNSRCPKALVRLIPAY